MRDELADPRFSHDDWFTGVADHAEVFRLKPHVDSGIRVGVEIKEIERRMIQQWGGIRIPRATKARWIGEIRREIYRDERFGIIGRTIGTSSFVMCRVASIPICRRSPADDRS